MQKIVIYSPKGGVGKTTLAVNLAAALSLGGKRVLLVDCDTQAVSGHEDDVWLMDVLHCEETLVADPGSVLFVPGGAELIGWDISPEQFSKAFRASASHNDYCILDTGPGVSPLTICALSYAERVIVPVQCQRAAIEALMSLEATLHKLGREIYLVVPSMVESRERDERSFLEELNTQYDVRCAGPIWRDVRIKAAANRGEDVFQHYPNCRGALAIRSLAERIERDGR